jgi:hypothetical protein
VKGGFVIIRHNEIRDELCDMAAKSFTPSAVRNEPKMNLCRAAKEGTCKPPATTDGRGVVLTRCLWEQRTDLILDVRVTDIDSKTYKDKYPFKVLDSAKNSKSESMHTHAPTSDDTPRPL